MGHFQGSGSHARDWQGQEVALSLLKHIPRTSGVSVGFRVLLAMDTVAVGQRLAKRFGRALKSCVDLATTGREGEVLRHSRPQAVAAASGAEGIAAEGTSTSGGRRAQRKTVPKHHRTTLSRYSASG
jgi:hypothetical protein